MPSRVGGGDAAPRLQILAWWRCHLPAGADCVRHQHRDRHRADAAGHGSDRGRFVGNFREGDVAHEPITALHGRIIDAIDTDIDDDRAFADMFGADEFRLADRRDEDIGRARDLGQTPAARVHEPEIPPIAFQF